MKVRALMNDGDGRFFEYEPTDLLRVGPTLEIDAPDINTALGRAWEIGNRMGKDEDGQGWPSSVRSLSVGDALVVEPTPALKVGPDSVQAYVVEHVGFHPIEAATVLASLAFGTVGRGGMGSFLSDRETK